MKLDYSEAKNKRTFQRGAFKLAENKIITALPGPNLNLYTSILHDNGFRKMIFFENNQKIFFNNMFSIPKNVEYYYDDILNNLDNNTYYDLDFCCSVISIEKYLKKINFLKEFSMTLAVGRVISIKQTLSILEKFENEGFYKYFLYRDTFPMLGIIKTQKNEQRKVFTIAS